MTRKAWAKRSGRSSKWITPQRRLALYIRDGFACAYCGRDLRNAKPSQINLDHLTPQVKGGGHESSNLITACATCNCARQHRPWRRYATAGAIQRIERLRHRIPNVELAKAIIRGDVPRCEALSRKGK